MGLELIAGSSGCGKTRYLYRKITDLAASDSRQNFYVLVPEQFTLSAQKALADMSKSGVIMNIDVLSFERLSYRVLSELGVRRTIMEDTGKSLLLRRIAQEREGELTLFSGRMRRTGYVDEVRSVISELSQYGVSPEDLLDFIKDQSQGTELFYKLSDIYTLYSGYCEYTKENVMTSEMALDVLAKEAKRSKLLKGAVFALDGYTGFTPAQMKVLSSLMETAKDIYVTVTADVSGDLYGRARIEDLFYMSKKMIRQLGSAAKETGFKTEAPVLLGIDDDIGRHKDNPELKFLEKNLFRPKAGVYEGKDAGSVSIYSLSTPAVELEFAASYIARCARQRKLHYSEFAIVCTDINRYEGSAKSIFDKYHIPIFTDKKNSILFHPLTELILSALETCESDLSIESVFRFLKNPLSGFNREDVDILENYCIARGVRGMSKWSGKFIKPAAGRGRVKRSKEEILRELEGLNEIREKAVSCLMPLYEAVRDKKLNVREKTKALYEFMTSLSLQEKLDKKKLLLEDAGDEKKALEYSQIYRMVIDLLDKMTDLMGDEAISAREYSEVLRSGFRAARLGTIPPGNDAVIIGDMERTRLEDIRVLIFVGANDGLLPKEDSGEGILTDLDKEVLKENEIELAPTGRELQFMQRYYLYLILTKPSEGLIVTYSRTDAAFKAQRPSYLISLLEGLFPALKTKIIEREDLWPDETYEAAFQSYAQGLTLAGEGKVDEHFKALSKIFRGDEKTKRDCGRLFNAAFDPADGGVISPDEARLLYGKVLTNSVTRLELFSRCPCSHFFEYGLKLTERAEYGFESFDTGSLLHDILKTYCEKVDENADFKSIDGKQFEKLLKEAEDEAVLRLENDSLLDSERGMFTLGRIFDIAKSSADAVTRQLAAGNFRPLWYELDFLTDTKNDMRLVGRIDRVDIYISPDDRIFLKIVDYKSGGASFDLSKLYYGRQLQLPVYLEAAKKELKKKYPGKEIVPAGIFYQRLDDPLAEQTGTDVKEEILKLLRPDGIVNLDPEAYRNMDTGLKSRSLYIPVSLKSDGSLGKSGTKGAALDELKDIEDFAGFKTDEIKERIMRGDIAERPYRDKEHTGCDFCPYKSACGFDIRRPGFGYEEQEKLDDDEAFSAIKAALKKDKDQKSG